VIGIFDLVEKDPSGTIVVSDFKTSSKGYSNEDISRNFQLTLYGMAAKANGYREREVLLRFDCVVKTKSPRFEQHYSSRTERDERRAVSKMQRVWDGISRGSSSRTMETGSASGVGTSGSVIRRSMVRYRT